MIWFGLVVCNRYPVVADSACQMLRPEPVAFAIAFWVCVNADCREGTCQTLEPYFDCEFDGHGAAGGGSTIAAAACSTQQIVVRISLELPSHPRNISEPLFFKREQVVESARRMRRGTFLLSEDEFVNKALHIGLRNDQRMYRRWIPLRELKLEQQWREEARWNLRLVFGIAAPAATCEWCLKGRTQLYVFRDDKFLAAGSWSTQFTAHVSITKQVTPVSLQSLSLEDLVVFLVGYVEDLTAFAHAHLWHDCHLGNLLMRQQPNTVESSSIYENSFYWHDFGGVSVNRHTPRPEQLEEFVRKMQEAIGKIETRIRHIDQSFSGFPKPSLSTSDANILKLQLREYTKAVQSHVMRWKTHASLLRQVLRSLSRTISPERYAELQFLLAEGDLA